MKIAIQEVFLEILSRKTLF